MAKHEDLVQHGSISIDAVNIMPIIKKWLYSDKDIFFREIVSNGMDAITKLKMLGLGEEDELKVTVTLDAEAGEIRISDNGIGMTHDEVEKYINQVAFSSAEEFLKNYTGEDQSGIIGHFGLGFYSAFIAATQVSIDSLSYQEGAKPVKWTSQDGIQFQMSPGSRQSRGTTITMHIAQEEADFLKGHIAREVLDKYCGFMAYPIYLEDLKGIEEESAARQQQMADHAKKVEEAKEKGEEAPQAPHFHDEPGPQLINDTAPLWLKAPRECTDEEYKQTYRKLFNTYEDPLFWIHLNVDYPFALKGILYFPRIRRDFSGQDGQIKLFNRQVFVADNIKEVIPEFLLVLKGVIDCPDLPLNVSRSFLQNDGYVRRISQHIVKKVSDKLLELFKQDRESYQGYWDDIHPFIKFGCIQDRKFYDALKDILLLKTTDGSYYTLDEYQARNEGKTEKKVYYTSDPMRQAASVAPFENRGIDVAVLDTLIDVNFLSFLEYSGNTGLSFMRVDADIKGLQDTDEQGDEGKELDQKTLEAQVRKALDQENLNVQLEALSDPDMPALLTEDEQLRRYKDLSRAYGQQQALPDMHTLVLNRRSNIIRQLASMEDGEQQRMLIQQVYDLARLSSAPLEGEQLRAFMKRSHSLLSLLLQDKDSN